MNCPICKVTLQISERQGVEIDCCPMCRGVWLDRGELEKISEMLALRSVSGPQRSGEKHDERHRDRYEGHREDSGYDERKPKRKESWFGELFDL